MRLIVVLIGALAISIYILSLPKDPRVTLSHYPCIYGGIFCPDIEIIGETAQYFTPVRDIFTENYQNLLERHSQLVIYHKGNRVVDLAGKSCWFDCSQDTYDRQSLQTVFSTTKVVTSIVIAKLVDRNIIQYEDKISKYWPEFAANGKENITIQDVMRHSAGLSFFDDKNPETSDLLPLLREGNINYLDEMARIIERSYSHYPLPNETKVAYHGITRGIILNELVRRVDEKRRTIGQFIQQEIAQPLELDYHVGVDKKKLSELPIFPHQSDSIGWKLYVAFSIIGRFILGDCLGFIDGVQPTPHDIPRFIRDDVLTGSLFNSPLIRGAEVVEGVWAIGVTDSFNTNHSRMIESPSSNGLTNARSMGKLMQSVLDLQIISKKTFEKLIRHRGIPEYDLGIHANTIYTDGGWNFFDSSFGAFEGFYGWSGIGGATMLLDVKDEIVIAYTTTRIETLSPWDDIRTQKLLSQVRKVINGYT